MQTEDYEKGICEICKDREGIFRFYIIHDRDLEEKDTFFTCDHCNLFLNKYFAIKNFNFLNSDKTNKEKIDNFIVLLKKIKIDNIMLIVSTPAAWGEEINKTSTSLSLIHIDSLRTEYDKYKKSIESINVGFVPTKFGEQNPKILNYILIEFRLNSYIH